jgi:hypothetical protein
MQLLLLLYFGVSFLWEAAPSYHGLGLHVQVEVQRRQTGMLGLPLPLPLGVYGCKITFLAERIESVDMPRLESCIPS